MTPTSPLSRREEQVLQLLLAGKSNKQIAAALHITISTVEFHLKNIYAKYQISSRTELILKLGQSTVAGGGENTENRDRLNLRNWPALLKETASRFRKEFSMENVENSNARAAGTSLTFFEAVRVCLVKYAEFDGRAPRAEFWWFALFVTLVASALALINEVLSSVFLVAVLLPLLAAGTRRLRDSGKSGWWQLYLLVPVGGLVILGYLWSLPPEPSPASGTDPA